MKRKPLMWAMSAVSLPQGDAFTDLFINIGAGNTKVHTQDIYIFIYTYRYIDIYTYI